MCNPTETSTEEGESPAVEAASSEPVAQVRHEDLDDSYGSSTGGAIFNFTNCIVGAGAIGLGGAFADSGGLISVFTILFFALLTKLSLDLVVIMSVEHSPTPQQRSASYEELGYMAYGRMGRLAVLLSKFLYSFGCLVAYIIVVKDNFAPALRHFLYGDNNNSHHNWFHQFLSGEGAQDTVTWVLGICVILPLCLLRDMTPLSSLGAVSIASMCSIVLIVLYIYCAEPDIRHEGEGTYQNWIQIRPGYVESWGTFVFTFVSQHTVNLAFESLRPEIRTVDTWKRVSSWSISIATVISLTVGLVVYMTFWQDTRSDLFDMYPPLRIVDLAKLLLCVTMLLTFPLPFFSCRELLIVFFIQPLFAAAPSSQQLQQQSTSLDDALQEPLLDEETAANEQDDDAEDSTSVIFEERPSRGCIPVMLPGEEKQLSLVYHVLLSTMFWGASTYLAIVSPNLGDILDLVGSASGTAMAFVLPGLLSFKLQGYTRLAAFILVVGGAIGLVGTIFSFKKLISDV
ncbi:Putative sodium-coupled neutral amino acid transporter 11 [Seminavis robusta]|uniref:Sodium-coupled neutral amino acid transporter 11 n=1 Tax=Seminavis robusta TaxID=568900 RepID=A0A9N8D8Y8_9STRA|nr:Putative sodium-coupled neutral amino acid transporter 11 [Seminavis robusta]|eukprot:Sro35_g022420.1 Putative sodium-coupled neutral amino acid transporter 11 (513) ;mRNA; f:95969-97716